MLLASMYAIAARRLVIRAPTGAFIRALPTRAFSISRRSAFAAAKTAKKTTTTSKKASSTKKVPAKSAKSKQTTKSTAKTAKAKKPATAAKKTTAASTKKTASKRKPKPLTEEEKLDKERRALKRVVLKEPPNLPDKTWPVFIAEWVKSRQGGLVERIKGASDAYKSLNATEMEKLKNTAERNRLANQAAYTAWLESHSVADIKAANLARARLTNKHNIRMRQIRDPRMPKRPRNAFSFFVSSKWDAGQVTAGVGESSQALGREWKALPAAQKQPFIELADADTLRYKGAMKTAGL